MKNSDHSYQIIVKKCKSGHFSPRNTIRQCLALMIRLKKVSAAQLLGIVSLISALLISF